MNTSPQLLISALRCPFSTVAIYLSKSLWCRRCIRGAVASAPVFEPRVMNLGKWKSRGPQDQSNPKFSRGAIMIPSQEVIRHWVRRSRTTTTIDYIHAGQLVSLMESLIFLPQTLASSESHLGIILACRIKWWVPPSCLLNCINTGSRLQ